MARMKITRPFYWLIAIAAAIATFVVAAAWEISREKAIHAQLSVKPFQRHSSISAQPVVSAIGTRISVPFTTLAGLLEQETTDPQQATGERQKCRKLIGVDICATLLWTYQIERTDPVIVEQFNNQLRLSVPLIINGALGIDGRGGRLLGLKNKKFNAEVQLIADLDFNIDSQWCPTISADISHRWISDPRLFIARDLSINLSSSADKALVKKTASLERKFATLIDCGKFRSAADSHWHHYSLPVTLPPDQPAFLTIVPEHAIAGTSKVLEDQLLIDLEIGATLALAQQPITGHKLVLPALRHDIASPGAVDIRLPVHIGYPHLESLLNARLGDKSFVDNGREIKIRQVSLYPTDQRLVFAVDFELSAYTNWLSSSGTLYLSGLPVLDHDSNTLTFDDLTLTSILDNRIWSLVSTAFHPHVVNMLKEKAVFPLSPHIEKLEKSLASALTEISPGDAINLQASPPRVTLVTVNPEADSLAALVHVTTRLHATVLPTRLIED